MPRVLLFDIDMTLVKTAGAGRKAMEAAFLLEFGIEGSTEGMLFDGRTDRGIFVECLERHGLANGRLDEDLARAFARYLKYLPATLDEKAGLKLPGVDALLQALAGCQAHVGLATGNIRRGAQYKLEHFGLWRWFAGGGFGDDHTVRAELVRDGITEMAAIAGCEVADCDVIVLGDTPLDVEAAHAAGARALGVATGRFGTSDLLAAGADFALPDLSDTGRVLEILLGQVKI